MLKQPPTLLRIFDDLAVVWSGVLCFHSASGGRSALIVTSLELRGIEQLELSKV